MAKRAAERLIRRSPSWEALFERFGTFQSMPCLMGTGPDMKRPNKAKLVKRLSRQFNRVRTQLPQRPSDLTQNHIDALLQFRGISTRSASKRPLAQTLWSGFWRAVILDRDGYRCRYCGRSGEEGVTLGAPAVRFALRLELDHVAPRSSGGQDYLLANIRTLCRLCNLARGRLRDEYFEADILSLAAVLSAHKRQGGAA
jgi:5-methylcytosine-specific restriction endonuclease McrA